MRVPQSLVRSGVSEQPFICTCICDINTKEKIVFQFIFPEERGLQRVIEQRQRERKDEEMGRDGKREDIEKER